MKTNAKDMLNNLKTDLNPLVEKALQRLKPAKCRVDNFQWNDFPYYDKNWIPVSATPLYNTTSYDTLTAEQNRRYNQYYALQKLEQFIWIETWFVINPVKQLLKQKSLPTDLTTLLKSFLEDEDHHNATLKKMLQLSFPDFYRNTDFHFFHVPKKMMRYVKLMVTFPQLFSSWVLMLGAFEEHTLVLNRLYKQDENSLDPLFSKVNFYHAIDEARHCSLDEILAKWLLEDQKGLSKIVNAIFLKKSLEYYYGAWGHDAPINQLVQDFPELQAVQITLLNDAVSQRGEKYNSHLFEKTTTPITYKNLQRYPMFQNAVNALVSKKSV